MTFKLLGYFDEAVSGAQQDRRLAGMYYSVEHLTHELWRVEVAKMKNNSRLWRQMTGLACRNKPSARER